MTGRALIYIRSPDGPERSQRLCLAWAEDHDVTVVALVIDDPAGRRWHDAVGVWLAGEVDYLVVLYRFEIPLVSAVIVVAEQDPPERRVRRTGRIRPPPGDVGGTSPSGEGPAP